MNDRFTLLTIVSITMDTLNIMSLVIVRKCIKLRKSTRHIICENVY